jgi:hypothetical protein
MAHQTQGHEIEHSARITITELNQLGCLKWGATSTMSGLRIVSSFHGTLAEPVCKVVMDKPEGEPQGITENRYIQFNYIFNDKSIEFKHFIEAVPCNIPGYRFYFRCSASTNDAYCGKRVEHLYFWSSDYHNNSIYACRHCLNLVYTASRHHKTLYEYMEKSRAMEKKIKYLKSWNHLKKANRLLPDYYRLQDLHDQEFLRGARKFMLC